VCPPRLRIATRFSSLTIPRFITQIDAFTREQSKLFSPNLVTLVSDIRGSFTYEGTDGFFEEMVAWSKHFFVNGQSRHEYVEETSTHVLVRMHGDLNSRSQ
jgi:hypothetical protein